MLPSKLPRVFLVAGIALILLVLGVNYYLYDGGAPYYVPPLFRPGPVDGEDSEQAAIGLGHIGESNTPSAATGTSDEPITTLADLPTPPELESDDPRPIHITDPCSELDVLRTLNLGGKVQLHQVCVDTVFSPTADRNIVANVSQSIFQDGTTVDLDECDSAASRPTCVPITLSVPPPFEPFDVSHLIFGIATEYERLQDAFSTFAHWLAGPPDARSKMIAAVADYSRYSNDEIQELQQQFRSADMSVTLVRPFNESHSTSQSHFSVLAQMLNYTTSTTQWFGLLDDDTFFPRGLKPLSDALQALDHESDMYVGTLSEDFSAIRTFGFMAFGGAGAYISAPLARQIGKRVGECIQSAGITQGDIIIRDCIYRNSEAKLTILPGLFQQDLMGDASGFFESGVQPPPINFHHWKSWFHEPVLTMAAAADFCGDCFLQRWRLGEDTVLTNGYSINQYRGGVEHLDLDTMEGTWDKVNEDFDFSIGPLRPKLGRDGKKSFKLAATSFGDQGVFKQFYVWKGDVDPGQLDEVIELDWHAPG